MKTHPALANIANYQSEEELFEALASIRTADEARLFFRDLCTPKEIEAFADRWRVVAAVKANKPYRQIYEETGVSVATVGRVARSLMFGEGGYNLIFTRLEKKKKNK